MNTVTMLELRRGAATVLGRLSKGERLILSHRGKPVARLEPYQSGEQKASGADPFLNVGARAFPAPKGSTDHRRIDTILYGKP